MSARIPMAAVALFGIGLLSGLPFGGTAEDGSSAAVATSETYPERDSLAPSALPEGSILRRTLGALATDDSAELAHLFDREVERMLRDYPNTSATFLEIARRWAEVDPQGMFDHMMAGGPFDKIRTGYFRSFAEEAEKGLFDTWLHSDTEAAIAAAFLAREHLDHASSVGISRVLQSLVKTDPARARSLLAQNADIMSDASSYLSRNAPRLQLDVFKQLPPSRSRALIISTMLDSWASSPAGAEAALAWIEKQPLDVRASSLGSLLASKSSTPATKENLERLRALVGEEPKYAARFMEKFGAGWAKDDLAGALAWSDATLHGYVRHEALSKLLEGGAQTNLDGVIDAFDDFRPGKMRVTAAGLIAGGLVERDPVAALGWVESLEGEPNTLKGAIDGWAKTWANEDKDAAGDYAREMPDGRAAERLLGEVAWSYTRGEPEAGFAWIETLSPDRASDATQLIVKAFNWRRWSEIEKTIAAMAPGAIRDEALRALGKATEITHGQEEALEWMRGLDESDRETAIEGLRWHGDQHVERFREKL